MKIRKMMTCLALLLVTYRGQAEEQSPSTADMQHMMPELQASHITANVPPEASFMKLLQRDIRAYLVANRLPAKSITVELLRRGATQSGVSYPKYYVWIRASDVESHHVEGVMRVAAIERVRFDITDFTRAASIRSDSAPLASVYPAPLIPAIIQRAKAQ
jgi:hypothetical protein